MVESSILRVGITAIKELGAKLLGDVEEGAASSAGNSAARAKLAEEAMSEPMRSAFRKLRDIPTSPQVNAGGSRSGELLDHVIAARNVERELKAPRNEQRVYKVEPTRSSVTRSSDRPDQTSSILDINNPLSINPLSPFNPNGILMNSIRAGEHHPTPRLDDLSALGWKDASPGARNADEVLPSAPGHGGHHSHPGFNVGGDTIKPDFPASIETPAAHGHAQTSPTTNFEAPAQTPAPAATFEAPAAPAVTFDSPASSISFDAPSVSIDVPSF